MTVKELGDELDALNDLFDEVQQKKQSDEVFDAAYKKLADQLDEEETTLRLYFDYEQKRYVLM